MRRPGSNECLQDKPRNRHFAEWRFLPLIRTVTVNPKIWNVIVIGMSLTSLPEDTVTNRLPYSFGALGGHKTIFIFPKTAHFVNSRRRTLCPQACSSPPHCGQRRCSCGSSCRICSTGRPAKSASRFPQRFFLRQRTDASEGVSRTVSCEEASNRQSCSCSSALLSLERP